jgi:hypothetical protein
MPYRLHLTASGSIVQDLEGIHSYTMTTATSTKVVAIAHTYEVDLSYQVVLIQSQR